MSETDELALDDVDISDVPSVGGHSPEDLSDEEDLVAPADDGVDIGEAEHPSRPESGLVPDPPADGES